jgi:hypothetical protein
MERVDFYANSWLPARALVLDALEKRFQIDSSGRIILFEQVCPWKVRHCPTSFPVHLHHRLLVMPGLTHTCIESSVRH